MSEMAWLLRSMWILFILGAAMVLLSGFKIIQDFGAISGSGAMALSALVYLRFLAVLNRRDLRVVIHQDDMGIVSAFSDDGISIFWVSETALNDRVYRMDPRPIPADMLSEAIGHSQDKSPENARAHALVAKIEGRPHLSAVSSDAESET